MLSENDKLKKVLASRSALIDALESLELTKDEFHLENYRLLVRMQMKPFQRVDTLEKGLYNYQFFNTMAKFYLQQLQTAHPKKRKLVTETIRNYYAQKDACILDILKQNAQEPVTAYYIETDAESISDALFEIVFPLREKMIFHSLDARVKQELLARGCFQSQRRRSLIHNYVNSRNTQQKGCV